MKTYKEQTESAVDEIMAVSWDKAGRADIEALLYRHYDELILAKEQLAQALVDAINDRNALAKKLEYLQKLRLEEEFDVTIKDILSEQESYN